MGVIEFEGEPRLNSAPSGEPKMTPLLWEHLKSFFFFALRIPRKAAEDDDDLEMPWLTSTGLRGPSRGCWGCRLPVAATIGLCWFAFAFAAADSLLSLAKSANSAVMADGEAVFLRSDMLLLADRFFSGSCVSGSSDVANSSANARRAEGDAVRLLLSAASALKAVADGEDTVAQQETQQIITSLKRCANNKGH